MFIIILLGSSPYDKINQAQYLKNKFNYSIISFNKILKNLIKKKSLFFKILSNNINNNNILLNVIILKIISNKIRRKINSNGIVIYGYPNNLQQLKDLREILKHYNINKNVYYIHIKIKRNLKYKKEILYNLFKLCKNFINFFGFKNIIKKQIIQYLSFL